jgi:glutamate-1-semialdehyde 2,1-aminomutase
MLDRGRIRRGEGQRVWDLDANEFVDFHNGFSAMLQGHAHPAIGAAVGARYAQGAHFAAPVYLTATMSVGRIYDAAAALDAAGGEVAQGAVGPARA